VEEKHSKDEWLLDTLLVMEQSIESISQELIGMGKTLEKIYDIIKSIDESSIPIKGKVSRWLERTGSKG
jgi:hypothetical protein